MCDVGLAFFLFLRGEESHVPLVVHRSIELDRWEWRFGRAMLVMAGHDPFNGIRWELGAWFPVLGS